MKIFRVEFQSMQPDTPIKKDLDAESPESNINVSSGKETSNGKQ